MVIVGHEMERMFVARIDNENPFGDSLNSKLKKTKDPTRENLKPVDSSLTFDQYLTICLREGYAMLEAEEKAKGIKGAPEPKQALENTLGEKSDNPYVKARSQVFKKMSPKARSVIEEMEKGSIAKDERYDKFVLAVTALGDKLSR